MKLVKEHIILEKFTEDSDPIQDLGIGMMHKIEEYFKKSNYKETIGSTMYPVKKIDDMLLACVDKKKYKYAKYLLDVGANVHTSVGIHDHDLDLPVRYAIFNNDLKMVKLLLKYGASITNAMRDRKELRHLEKNHRYKFSEEIKKIVDNAYKFQNKKFIYEKFVEDSDPIADMNIGMIHQIKLWMKSINEPFKNKNQALVICAKKGKIDYVKYLLSAGANVHANDDWALRWASNNGHTEVVKVLLSARANVHAGNDLALRWASGSGHTEVVKLLLDAGANVHAGNDEALQWASGSGHIEVVKVLKDWIAKEKKTKVRESLNEKFTEEDSDPVHNMGIGISKIIKDCIENIREIDKPLAKNITQYKTTDMNINKWVLNNDSRVLRKIEINIYSNRFQIGFFRNLMRDKNKKLLDKVEYAKKLLKGANISSFINAAYELDRSGENPIDAYTCDEVIFTIKEKYLLYFKELNGDHYL